MHTHIKGMFLCVYMCCKAYGCRAKIQFWKNSLVMTNQCCYILKKDFKGAYNNAVASVYV